MKKGPLHGLSSLPKLFVFPSDNAFERPLFSTSVNHRFRVGTENAIRSNHLAFESSQKRL